MPVAALVMASMLAFAAHAAADVSGVIEPAEVAVGAAARITITASGYSAPAIVPPRIPGLTVTPEGQSRRIESVNGVARATVSVTYQVTASKPGTYVITGIASGVQPLVLKVDADTVPAATAGEPKPGAAAAASPAGASPGTTTGDATAFVRLVLPKQELYVGESVPVEIDVGTRDGVVASLNGLPTLNGDAFTLDNLSPDPQQKTAEVIDGKPYTVFVWRSVLAAVKPGELSLSMETPLTVRVRDPNPAADLLDDSTIADLLNDPAFQGFFNGTTERDVTVTSAPLHFTVLPLPSVGRPANFSGAVGEFTVSGALTADRVTAGDPVTLRVQIAGTGNFDRVDSAMLTQAPHWKAYQPTAKFVPQDGHPNQGEKTFEQPLIATDPGVQSVPAVSFSYFDPVQRRYVEEHTTPLTVDVMPAPKVALAAAPERLPTDTAAPQPKSGKPQPTGLRRDHPVHSFTATLVPLYFQPSWLALPSLMLLAFPGAWWWRRRRPRPAPDPDPVRLVDDLAFDTGRDVRTCFRAARRLLQTVIAARWHVPPDVVTLAEIEARLGPQSETRKLFAFADEALYSGRTVGRADLEQWQQRFRRLVGDGTFS